MILLFGRKQILQEFSHQTYQNYHEKANELKLQPAVAHPQSAQDRKVKDSGSNLHGFSSGHIGRTLRTFIKKPAFLIFMMASVS